MLYLLDVFFDSFYAFTEELHRHLLRYFIINLRAKFAYQNIPISHHIHNYQMDLDEIINILEIV